MRFYNRGGERNPNLDKKLRSLNLGEEEMGDIGEFMRALTSDDVLSQAQYSTLQTRIAVPLEAGRKGVRPRQRHVREQAAAKDAGNLAKIGRRIRPRPPHLDALENSFEVFVFDF